MITRETLHRTKKQVKDPKFGFSPGQQEVVHTLIDSNLQLLDLLDGGMDAKERERQIGLALVDLQGALELVKLCHDRQRSPLRPDVVLPSVGADRALARAKYTLDLIAQMVKAKGPAWQRKWDWYQPRIAEEFDSQ